MGNRNGERGSLKEVTSVGLGKEGGKASTLSSGEGDFRQRDVMYQWIGTEPSYIAEPCGPKGCT